DRVVDLTAAASAFDQPRAVEDGEMLAHRLTRDRQLSREGRGRRVPTVNQRIKHAQARRFGERIPELWFALEGCGAHVIAPAVGAYRRSFSKCRSHPSVWLFANPSF